MENVKRNLMNDMQEIIKRAREQKYMLSLEDCFALGYMSAKSDLEKLLNNESEVVKACADYDKTDDLGLFDTIGETLIDLDVIKNDGSL